MDKNIDESWKDSVENDKKTNLDTGKGATKDQPEFQANFNTLVSGMAMEALIFLGELPNPISKKKEANLPQAKYIIDTISLLKEKTKGNLTADEANALDNILYEVQSKFVSKSPKQ